MLGQVTAHGSQGGLMAQVRQHVNARLTARQRRAMVAVVIVERTRRPRSGSQVDRRCASRPLRRRGSLEPPGRCSSPEVRAEVIGLRRCRRRGAAWDRPQGRRRRRRCEDPHRGPRPLGPRRPRQAPVRCANALVNCPRGPRSCAIVPGGGWRVHGRGQAPIPPRAITRLLGSTPHVPRSEFHRRAERLWDFIEGRSKKVRRANEWPPEAALRGSRGARRWRLQASPMCRRGALSPRSRCALTECDVLAPRSMVASCQIPRSGSPPGCV